MCLRVTGPLEGHEVPVVQGDNGTHSTLQRDLGEDVVAQVGQHAAGVGQWAQRR